MNTTTSQLPEIIIELTGMVKASNLDQVKAHALAVFDGINTDLKTDEDFSEAEQTVKWCGDVESKLDATKTKALSQTQSIDQLFITIDALKEECRQKRLTLEKAIKSRKESIRAELVMNAQNALNEHLQALNSDYREPYLKITADFAGAIRGKKSIQTCRDAIDAALANAKIDAAQKSATINANLDLLNGDYSLFPDFRDYCLQEPAFFASLYQSRDAERSAKEAARLETERERIRKEEIAKIEAERKFLQQAEENARRAQVLAEIKANEQAEAARPQPEAISAECKNEAAHTQQKPKDLVTRFLETKNYGSAQDRIRQILNEFVKFSAETKLKE